MPAYSFEGFTPVVDARAFVHPLAVLIGDVSVGPGCYVAPGASLRGDFGRILLGAGSNVQDNCVLHSFPGKDVLLEEDAHVGHGAVLHGCSVRRGALIGIHAVVMDDVVVGEEAFVGASAFVPARFVVPPRTLVTGVPARIVRELKAEELAWKATGTREYQELAARCLATLREVAPLAAPEPGRPARAPSTTVPLHSIERGKRED
jgi:phenylacetic acid degradation protein